MVNCPAGAATNGRPFNSRVATFVRFQEKHLVTIFCMRLERNVGSLFVISVPRTG